MADAPTLYRCLVCPATVIQGNGGWSGHSRSKAHIEAGGDADSFESAGGGTPAEEPALLAEAMTGLAPGELAALLDENVELKEKILRLERDKAQNSPLASWPVWETTADVEAWFGPDGIRTIGELALVKLNRDRQRKMLPPLYSQDPDEYERMIAAEANKAVTAMVRQQTRWTSGVAEGKHIRMRTFKMIAPVRECTVRDCPAGGNTCYRHGTMRQIPVELQINNGAASLNDPIERYKRKGFKPADPVRCKLRDCYRAAAADPTTGNWSFGMYCSLEHHNYVEGSKQTSTGGNEMTVYQSAMTG